MQLLANFFVFLTFFIIPFWGAIICPCIILASTGFGLKGLFGPFACIRAMLSYLKDKRGQSDFLEICPFLLYHSLFFRAVSLFYSWNRFSTLVYGLVFCSGLGMCLCLSVVTPNKEVCFAGLVAGAVFVSISAILQLKILFPNLMSTFQQGLICSSFEGAGWNSLCFLHATTTSWVDTWFLFFLWLFTLAFIGRVCSRLLHL